MGTRRRFLGGAAAGALAAGSLYAQQKSGEAQVPRAALPTDPADAGFTQSGAGSVARSVQSKLRDVVNAADFGFSTAGSGAANAAAIRMAITSLGPKGGQIHLPGGSFSVASDTLQITQKNVTIVGEGSGMAYEASDAGTKLIFGPGTIGFDLTRVVGAGNYTVLKNLSINGYNHCRYPVKAKGFVMLDHVDVTGSAPSGAGIWLEDLINSTALDHVSCCGNRGYGLLIGKSGGQNTVMYVNNFVARSNLVGVRIENAVHASFRDCVLESNYQEGLQIYRTSGDYGVRNLTFENVHMENNYAGSSNYNAVIDSYDPADITHVAQYLKFDNCLISCSGATKAINVAAGAYITFDNFYTDPASVITLAANSKYCVFLNRNGGKISDSGNRNWTMSYDTSGVGGLSFSKGVLAPSTLGNYVWNAWNPSDVAGTLTNGSGAGTATGSGGLFYTVANSSGTVAFSFNQPGRYLVTITLSASSTSPYRTNRMQVVLGGTAARLAARNTYWVTGERDSDAGYSSTITIGVNASAANQTLTILPKGSVSGGGGTKDHDFRAEASALFVGT